MLIHCPKCGCQMQDGPSDEVPLWLDLFLHGLFAVCLLLVLPLWLPLAAIGWAVKRFGSFF